jgi:hypothetical protein
VTVREVLHGDGLAWLHQAELGPEHALVTSLPDRSELNLDLASWRAWFLDAAELVLRRTHPQAVAIFYQTDVKDAGLWVDKAFLVQTAAVAAGAGLLFHKIVCRVPAGQVTFGRPAYAHLLAFSAGLRLSPAQSSADVLPALGHMTWSRAMGSAACSAICRFLVTHTPSRVVVDPFCGRGTMLAAANAHGLDALGVEITKKRAALARRLVWKHDGTPVV